MFQVTIAKNENKNNESCDHQSETSGIAVANEKVEEDRNRSAKRDMTNLHNRAWSFESGERERKSLLTSRRSQSLKRREGSWNQKWEDKNREEETNQRQFWTKPGKLNNSYWEQKFQAESFLPPKTLPPKKKLRDIYDGRITPVERFQSIFWC